MEPGSDRRFETLFEQAPFSLQLIGADGRTLRVNRAWLDLWQFTDDDRGERFVLEQYNIWEDAQLNSQGILELFRRAFAGESVRTPAALYDPAQLGKPGRARWVVGHIHPIRNDHGEIAEVMLVHEDVTDRRAAETELRESERRLKQLADTIPQLAWMATPEGDIHWFNRRWYEYTGTTPEQMRDGGWLTVHHPDWAQGVGKVWTQTIERSESAHMTFPLRAADGTYRTFLAMVAPLCDERGRVTQWFGTNTDVTPLQTAEEGLRRAEEGLRLATRAGRIGIWEWNLTQDRVTWSDETYALHDMVPGTFGGRSADFQRLVHPEDLPMLWSRVQAAVANEDGFDAEFRTLLPDGNVRWLSTWAHLHRDERGSALRMVGATISIDDHKRIEARLQDNERRKDEFLAMLAHELRNPLAPIFSAVQLLSSSRLDDPKVRFATGVIQRQVTHLAELVDDLIDVSRVTRGLIQLDLQPVDLQTIVEAAIEQVRPVLEAREHRLKRSGREAPVWVRADRTRLIQVITNLLNNAAKYTPDGGALSLRIEPFDTEVNVEVADNGQGIDSALIDRIFEPFTQGARAPDRAQGGLGIGLSLVRSLMALHGGSVAAASPGIGGGSTFRITLPVIANPLPDTSPASPPMPCTSTCPPRKVIVVDDNSDAADALAAWMRGEGHRVSVFYDAASLLAQRFHDSPDVLILDIGLPDLDGFELARRLRQRDDMKSSLLIALTGYGQPVDRERAREAGFDHHLVKPADSEALRQLLASAGKRTECRASVPDGA